MNKTFLTVAQVFAIIGAVFFIFYGFLFMVFLGYVFGLSSSGNGINMTSMMGLIFIGIGALNIVAAVRLNVAKINEKIRGEALGWSIYLLFTTYFIGGIFGIIGATTRDSNSASNQPNSIEQQLKELENLFDKGLISKEEYQIRRMKIIERV